MEVTLVAVALVASILSGIVGMAGGMLLLSVMLLYFEPLIAIPLHGVIQLVSNGSRSFIQRRFVAWELVWSYAVGLLPMGVLGLLAARALAPERMKLLIGVFVLLATWRPTWLVLGMSPTPGPQRRRFLLLGGVVGFLQMNIGATGPLIAPFFLGLRLSRQALVGTKAAAQTLGHLTKILLFGAWGFAYPRYAILLTTMCAAVVVGTWIGSQLLERINERAFRWLFKTVLTGIAIHLVASQIG